MTMNNIVGQVWPSPPRWVNIAMGASGFASAVADVWISRQANKPAPAGSTLYDRIGDVYRSHREMLEGVPAASAQAIDQAPVNVTVNVGGAPASRYLASEGAEDVSTGCIPCGRAHLGALQGMLERAADAAQREGACGKECGRWVSRAAQEPAALLARDWTPEKIAATPPAQQAVLAKYVPQVQGLEAGLTGQDGARASLTRASALLAEAQRFAGSGDGMDHPEVTWRMAEAEKELTVAERGGNTLDNATQQRLRKLRQQTYNAVHTPADLGVVATEADAITTEVQGAWAASLTPQQVAQIAGKAKALRESFRSDLAATEKQGSDAA